MARAVTPTPPPHLPCFHGRTLTAVSSSQTAPPGLVLRVPAEAATANVVAMNADFMVRVLKIKDINISLIIYVKN